MTPEALTLPLPAFIACLRLCTLDAKPPAPRDTVAITIALLEQPGAVTGGSYIGGIMLQFKLA